MNEKIAKTCNTLGCYSFTTVLGVGFIAYSATHVYIYFCAPSGFWGFIQSLVVMDSTFCQAMMGIVHHSQSLYGAMMVAFMFAGISAIGKGVAWMTGSSEGEVPTVIQSRAIRRI